MKKCFSLIFILLVSCSLKANSNPTEPILSEKSAQHFIENWDMINSEFIKYSEKKPDDVYFSSIENLIYSITDMTIFMIGYSDVELEDVVERHRQDYISLLNIEIPEEVKNIYLKAKTKDGHKVLCTMLFGSILLGIEKRAVFEKNNPENAMDLETILRNTKAHLILINDNDLRIIDKVFPSLPEEINRYCFDID